MGKRRWRRRSVWSAVACVVLAAGTVSVAGTSGTAFAAASQGGPRAAAGPEDGLAWNTADEVPGLAAVSERGVDNDNINSLSCSSAGNCAVGGDYWGENGGQLSDFVSGEEHGRWADAARLRGTGTDAKSYAKVTSVSCTGPGDCAAGGLIDGNDPYVTEPVVASEKNGAWGKAEQVPGTADLATGGGETEEVSCWSAGNCVAVGALADADPGGGWAGDFAATETDGVWQPAIRLSGVVAIKHGGYAFMTGLSCVQGGNCAATGYYSTAYGVAPQLAFVADAVHGVWGPARTLTGFAASAKGETGESVSCAAAGQCAVSGSIQCGCTSHPPQEAFVANEVNGAWGSARTITDAYDADAVSCPAPGDCVAAGDDIAGNAVLLTESGGTWSAPRPVPGLDRLNAGRHAVVTGVSCPRTGYCGITGNYRDHEGSGYHAVPFVDTEARGSWAEAMTVPGAVSLGLSADPGTGLISCVYPLACTATATASTGIPFTTSTKTAYCGTWASRPAGAA